MEMYDDKWTVYMELAPEIKEIGSVIECWYVWWVGCFFCVFFCLFKIVVTAALHRDDNVLYISHEDYIGT